MTPFEVVAPAPPASQVARKATEAASGARIFVISSESVYLSSSPLQIGLTKQVIDSLRPRYRLVETAAYTGVLSLGVLVFASV